MCDEMLNKAAAQCPHAVPSICTTTASEINPPTSLGPAALLTRCRISWSELVDQFIYAFCAALHPCICMLVLVKSNHDACEAINPPSTSVLEVDYYPDLAMLTCACCSSIIPAARCSDVASRLQQPLYMHMCNGIRMALNNSKSNSTYEYLSNHRC